MLQPEAVVGDLTAPYHTLRVYKRARVDDDKLSFTVSSSESAASEGSLGASQLADVRAHSLGPLQSATLPCDDADDDSVSPPDDVEPPPQRVHVSFASHVLDRLVAPAPAAACQKRKSLAVDDNCDDEDRENIAPRKFDCRYCVDANECDVRAVAPAKKSKHSNAQEVKKVDTEEG
jgi:hypothetical protein